MSVHCGDFTNHGSLQEVREFAAWLASLPHRHKVIVPGNHDMLMDPSYYSQYWSDWSSERESTADALAALHSVAGVHVLIDDGSRPTLLCYCSRIHIHFRMLVGIVIEGVRIWGSPWIPQLTAWRTAFNKSCAELQTHWRESLPLGSSVDILVTHTPARGDKYGAP